MDELWVDLANGIDVEKTGVLEGLEDVMVNIVDIGDIFLVIVLLSEGDVGVGVVGSGGGDIELGGQRKGVVLRSYDVGVSILVIPIRGVERNEGGREEGKRTGFLFVLRKCTSKDWVSCRCSQHKRCDAYGGREGRGMRMKWWGKWRWTAGGRGWKVRMDRWREGTSPALGIWNRI